MQRKLKLALESTEVQSLMFTPPHAVYVYEGSRITNYFWISRCFGNIWFNITVIILKRLQCARGYVFSTSLAFPFFIIIQSEYAFSFSTFFFFCDETEMPMHMNMCLFKI